MKFTVQYIPLNKIKPDLSVRMTDRIKKLRSFMWDGMHLVVVRKNRKDRNFIVVSGHDRFEYLRKHTNRKYAPCVVDEMKAPGRFKSFMNRFRRRRLPDDFREIDPDRLSPASWSIIRRFLKKEPRFAKLSRRQKIQVLLLGIRYKRTAVLSMRKKVEDLLSK